MDPEYGDAFHGASPGASPIEERENYDDLLGLEVPIEDLDLEMHDFQGGFPELSYKAPVAKMVDQQAIGPDITSDRQDLGSVPINWETNATVPQQGNEMASIEPEREDAVNSDNISSQDTGSERVSKIKKEPLDVPFILGIPINTIEDAFEISDTEDTEALYKHGTMMSDGVIILSDGEDQEEIILFDDGTSSVAIKKENPDVELLGATSGTVDVSDSENDGPSAAPTLNLGTSFLRRANPRAKRTAAEIEKMKRIQRIYAEKALGRNLGPGTGRAFITPGQPQTSEQDSPAHPLDDEFAWMSQDVAQDSSPVTDFLASKKAYKAKRKARKNTLEDDIQFKKAQNEENQRLKKLAREAADTDSDDEAEESDDGLFVSQRPSSRPSSKRPFASMMDMIDNDDDDEEVVPVDDIVSKKPKPATPDLSTKKSRERALQKELKCNMLAGIEAFLLRNQKRIEDKAAKAAAVAGGNGGKKASRRTRKAKLPDLSAKRTKTGRMNNIGSLITSNIYEDSNANLDRQALPVVTEKKKKEFMSSLIANIPLEDKKQATLDKNDILRASTLLGSRKVRPDGHGGWTLKGMKSSLYHYQMTGAAYMRTREIGEQHPYGGILADEMGLGKTVQMLATMVSNRQADPEESKCTLIVCSPALMRQWETELEKHVEPNIFGRIVRHHAGTKLAGKGVEVEMERADIILTTYGEVVKSYPKCEIPGDLETSAEKEAWWCEEWDEKRDLLHRAHFYRVVLDEAQVIKNYHSQTSIACRALMAKHRWAISGTPLHNRLDELFPYFKFLRVRHTGSIGVFRQNFCLKDSDVCNKRLHSFLDGVMIRRTHQDSLLGAPLIKLPKNTQETVRLQFNNVERNIYETVRSWYIHAINTAARHGTLEEYQQMVITYFQRLRQMVAHIFLLQEVFQEADKKIQKSGDLHQVLFSNETNISELEDQMLRGMRRMVTEKDKDGVTSDTVPLYASPNEAAKVPKAGNKAGKKSSNVLSRFSKLLKEMKKNSKWSELREHTLCQTCGGPPEEPYVTSCLHLYCKECLANLAYEASRLDLDETACHKCQTIFTESKPCEGLKELEIPDLSASVFQDKDKAPAKKKFKLTMNYVDSKESGLVLSTKTLAVKAQLEKWIREDPDRKIIVFTEWLMIMHVLSRICQMEGWKCCHYNGKLSHKARDQSLNAFRDPNSDVKVLIASLKCGGTGLNLTAASRVICVDLWFNSCVEQQAFARVHRIGQDKETFITRYVVQNTVDEQLLKMQEEKREIISSAMDDRSVLANLTLPELLKLFGPVAYDENSKPFILLDDDLNVPSMQPSAPRAGEDSAP